MKLLDLFCCQGGAGYGFEQSGFEVTGVDIEPQPRHRGNFIQADALEYVSKFGHLYDYIHASPPCQSYSKASMQHRLKGKEYPDLVAPTRDLLLKIGKPFSIENVPGAPLINAQILCGAMFGLPTYRHRLFETNWGFKAPDHPEHVVKNQKMGRKPRPDMMIQYVGNFSGVNYVREFTGCFWMDQKGLAQSIPPQYTKYIGLQFIDNYYNKKNF